jgi:membrane-associated PAP2 superfamily phosphatase
MVLLSALLVNPGPINPMKETLLVFHVLLVDGIIKLILLLVMTARLDLLIQHLGVRVVSPVHQEKAHPILEVVFVVIVLLVFIVLPIHSLLVSLVHPDVFQMLRVVLYVNYATWMNGIHN